MSVSEGKCARAVVPGHFLMTLSRNRDSRSSSTKKIQWTSSNTPSRKGVKENLVRRTGERDSLIFISQQDTLNRSKIENIENREARAAPQMIPVFTALTGGGNNDQIHDIMSCEYRRGLQPSDPAAPVQEYFYYYLGEPIYLTTTPDTLAVRDRALGPGNALGKLFQDAQIETIEMKPIIGPLSRTSPHRPSEALNCYITQHGVMPQQFW